jgi:hypothetical protein
VHRIEGVITPEALLQFVDTTSAGNEEIEHRLASS